MASPPSPLEAIARLLADLARRRSHPPPGGGRSGDSLAASVSSLAAALNPHGGGASSSSSSGTRVLDAVLSLMCFDPMEVDRARVDCLVRTTVSALSASVSCRVDHIDGAEMLTVGSSVAPGDCRELVHSCAALLEKLGDPDVADHSYDLLYAVVKAALLSPRYRCLFPLPYYREDEDSTCDMGTISSVLTRHPTYQVLPNDYTIPLRGLGAVLELQTAVVSSVLDVLFEPMAWGISMELGQKLPFSYDYFPHQHVDLLAILTGPLSCRKFVDLTSYIDSQSHASKGSVKYNSSWSMIVNFPLWFNFATALLFHREGSHGYLSEALSMEIISESIRDVNLAHRAAMYLSWVLCPSNEDQRQILAGNILELSHSWARNNKKGPSHVHHTSTVNHRRKLRIPTVGDTEKLHLSTNPVSSLIKEFDDRCVKFCSKTANSQVQDEELSDLPIHFNFLHLWIPLGILLVSSSFVNDQDCDMLLHYSSTGQVLESNEVQRKTKDHICNDSFSASCKGFTETWASAGASLVFGWLDLIINMSAVIFEREDICDHFVSQLKSKTNPYLLKCLYSLLEVLDEASQRDFLVDLHDRLLNWNKKGQSFDGFEAFEDIILRMNKKFHFRT
ncbi:hypothetical protein OsI_21682 [Oryza sativa Indica Group]|uniref:Uncharacterized protein n=1 Tax=Oryza sativa subsp. indica TaxID=39946 RepID=A2Y9E1_ORYSI|nr:hypothetical protein OsI_21682 [Oryza sativa Indica Group]